MTRLLLILVLTISGCKFDCEQELIEARARNRTLEIKISQLERNRTDVIEAGEETAKCLLDRKKLELEFAASETKNRILEAENDLLIEQNAALIEYISEYL